ncbi:MAG: exonuclease domain-containing protein [Candidatus Buchananbacteria bacterium]
MSQIIILDTETTGLDENSRLVQLAYKNFTNGEVVNAFFKPPILISYGAMATHHITNEMVADKPSFFDSQEKINLIRDLEIGILVAHNALFDINVLNNEDVAVEKYIDTLRVTKHLIDCERYDLQYLRYYLNFDLPQATAHDALGDILILEKLFEYLKNLVKTKLSLNNDDQVFKKLMELTNLPILLNTISFGKYRGKTFEEINRIDSGYLQWLYDSESKKNQNEQNESLIYTLKQHLYLEKF